MVKLCLQFSFRYRCVHFMFELFCLLRSKKKGKSILFPTSCLASKSYLEEVIYNCYLSHFVF